MTRAGRFWGIGLDKTPEPYHISLEKMESTHEHVFCDNRDHPFPFSATCASAIDILSPVIQSKQFVLGYHMAKKIVAKGEILLQDKPVSR